MLRWLHRRTSMRRLGPGAALTLVIGYAAFFAYRLVRDARIENYLRDLTVNDSYYYLQVARNFAAVHFSTADGINLTNGYHPLWAWLATPIYWFTSEAEAALPWVKSLEVALLALAASFLVLWARRLGSSVCLALPAVVLFLGSRSLTIAMEGAAAAAALAACAFLSVHAGRHSSSRTTWGAFGALIALLPWARLELIAVSLTVCGALAFLFSRRELRCPWPWKHFLLVTVAATLSYFALQLVAFGTAVPVSGQLKTFWSALLFERQGTTPWQNLEAFWADGRYRNGLLLSAATLLTLFVSWTLSRYRQRAFLVDHLADAFMLGLVAFTVGRFLFCVGWLHHNFSQQDWYFAPNVVFQAMFWPYLIHRASRLLASLNAKLGRYAAVLAAAAYLLSMDWKQAEAHLASTTGNSRVVDWEVADYRALAWMERELPPGAVVGSTDSGVFAYFGDFEVINLDGLINSPEYYRRLRAQDVESWLLESGITHLANNMPAPHKTCDFMRRRMRQDHRFRTRCKLLRDEPSMRGRRIRLWRFGDQRRATPAATKRESDVRLRDN